MAGGVRDEFLHGERRDRVCAWRRGGPEYEHTKASSSPTLGPPAQGPPESPLPPGTYHS